MATEQHSVEDEAEYSIDEEMEFEWVPKISSGKVERPEDKSRKNVP